METSNAPVVLNMKKGEILDLNKGNLNLTTPRVGLGWDVAKNGPKIDMDLFMFGLRGEKLLSKDDICFYGNKICKGFELDKDNRDGQGEGWDENIRMKLASVAPEITVLVIGCNIYEAKENKQNFQMIENAKIGIIGDDDKTEIATYAISEKGDHTGFIMGKLHRDGEGWRFEAIGTTVDGTINDIISKYQ